jgi:Uma2 family endonuclease
MVITAPATLADLYQVERKAELINGEITLMPSCGHLPNRAGGSIYLSLRLYEAAVPQGFAYTDNIGFNVDLPHRKSFSPDAAFYVGPATGMRFLDGAPVFAVEVRSENDYGRVAERKIHEKIDDYFAAGTQVVWDVDLLGTDVVRVYRAAHPDIPTIYRRGEVAEAEPALPGWSMAVNDLFR